MSAPLARVLTLEPAGAFAALPGWVADFARDASLPPRAAFALDLVLAEVVANLLEHAEGVTTITLACTAYADQLMISVHDDGVPFDPAACPPVDLPDRLADATPGGLGLHLVRRYTSELSYGHEDQRNVLRLVVPFVRA